MLPSIHSIMRRLRGHHLALLIALDETGSVRKAATQMALSQPAITKALREIETTFGTELFVRSSRGIAANEVGRSVIRHARLIRSELGDLREEIAGILRGSGGTLAVGAVMGAIPTWMTPALRMLRDRQPDISVEVSEDTSARLLGMLDQRALDVVLGRPNVSMHTEAYDFVPLAAERLEFVVGANSPLASRKRVQLRELADLQWIVFSAQMPMRLVLEQVFDDAGIDFPAHALETSSTFATVSLLRSDDQMVAMMPSMVASYFETSGLLKVLPLQVNRTSVPFGIVTRKGAPHSQPVEAFIECCVSLMHDQGVEIDG
ncbi:LysR family transcriptional regulator [Pararobbsia alpina]|uniref:LysR family transcriptional regulator n=1 Tax=Pararobbsia alpina TaxID=621374 RepID=UPI0039A50773